MNTCPRIAVVGTGPVGRALAAAYVSGGGQVAVIVSRDASRAAAAAPRVGATRGSADLTEVLAADVVLVCVPDRVLAEVAAGLAALPAATAPLLVHTSGALPAAVLAACGRRAASLHPLQSFPDLADDAALASRVAGTHFFHEGDDAERCAELTAVWRGTLHRLAR